MKFKSLLILFLFNLGLGAVGQSPEPVPQDSYVTFNFITPYVGLSPRWKTGIYTPVAKNVYLGAELGFGSELLSPQAKIKLGRRYLVQHNYRSFEFGPEIIYMVHQKHFISMKYSHLSHSASMKDGTILSQPDELYYDFASLDYDRKISSFHIFYGYMDKVSKRIGFMLKIGWGGRNKTVELSNIKGKELSSKPHVNGFAFTNDGSAESSPIAFDLKIYYLFR